MKIERFQYNNNKQIYKTETIKNNTQQQNTKTMTEKKLR